MPFGLFAFCLLLSRNDFMTWHWQQSRPGIEQTCSALLRAPALAALALLLARNPQNTRPLKISAIKPETVSYWHTRSHTTFGGKSFWWGGNTLQSALNHSLRLKAASTYAVTDFPAVLSDMWLDHSAYGRCWTQLLKWSSISEEKQKALTTCLLLLWVLALAVFFIFAASVFVMKHSRRWQLDLAETPFWPKISKFCQFCCQISFPCTFSFHSPWSPPEPSGTLFFRPKVFPNWGAEICCARKK